MNNLNIKEIIFQKILLTSIQKLDITSDPLHELIRNSSRNLIATTVKDNIKVMMRNMRNPALSMDFICCL